MLHNITISLTVGTILGFLSGLGIGGGSLLLLWLTLVLNQDSLTARAINLLFFLPAALTALSFRWKQGRLPLKKILPAMLSGAASSAAFTLLGQRMDTNMLEKLFGILLLITGARELMVSTRNDSEK